MFPQEIAIGIFKTMWGLLLIIACIAHLRFKGRIVREGGIIANLLVAAPYLVVFGWFSARDRIGTFAGNSINQIAGIVLALIGICGYVISISYLRKNWSIQAAVKEGHTLVQQGPYKFVRHPMYFFMILVMLGSGLLISNYLIILYTPVVVALYYIRAQKEEELLAQALPGYAEYAKKVKRLIPYIL